MEDAEIDLRRLFGLVRRRIFVIGAATLASAGLALAASVVVVPIYSATSLVAFDPQQKDLLDPTTSSHAAIADNARIESEVELLRSDTVLLKVIADRHLADDVVAAPGLRTRALAAIGLRSLPQSTNEDRQVQALAKLRGAVSVERRGPTYLIAVNVKSADPTQAADLANTIARTYIDTQIASKVEAMLSSRDVLQARLLEARSEIISSEAAFHQFLEQSIAQLVASSDGSGVAHLDSQLQALANMRAEADQRADLVEANLSSKNWEGLQAAFASEPPLVLAQQRQALATQVSSIDAVSPTNQQITAGLASTEQQLAQFADSELVELRNILAGLNAQQHTVL
jgi:uncharacterized protein involved in exopolysaccharide biosynthesis